MADLKDATVTMTVKQLAGLGATGILLLLAGLWAVFQLTTGGLQNDVGAIRTAVDGLSAERAESVKESYAVETSLRSDLAELTAQLRETTATLSALSTSVAGLDTSVRAVDDKISLSIVRQQDFERWVVTMLSQQAQPTKYQISAEWDDQQDEIVRMIVSNENDPLVSWWNITENMR